MHHLPIFLSIRGRVCLLVGGGAVAARKARLLRRAGARVSVAARALNEELAELLAAGEITHRAEAFAADQLDGCALAVAATDDRALNARVARHARLRGVPVNVVDDPKLSSFIMPAIVDRSPVIVAVSTGGAAPVLARRLRALLEVALPKALGRLAAFSGEMRPVVARRVPDPVRRRRFWERVFEGRVAELAFAGRDAEAEALFGAELDAEATRRAPAEGEVHLVGAGPGDPELLTLRAARLIRTADAIVYDRLVAPEILDFARRDAELIFAGKRAGNHSMAQEDISALLVRLAGEGKRVVRLKGGDPFVFGRGGEEMEAVAGAGIPVHVVPGITAATGCGAAAGIPLTHREHADRVVVVTGQGRGGGLPALDWAALARPRQTLVIYMGLGTLPEIAARLIGHGLPAATPAAVIESGTTPAQRVIAATLADLPARAAAAAPAGPVLIVIGEVVRLARVDASAAPAALAVSA